MMNAGKLIHVINCNTHPLNLIASVRVRVSVSVRVRVRVSVRVRLRPVGG